MKYSVLGKELEVHTDEGYTRAPHWSNTYSIDIYFYDQCGKGSFSHEIICRSQLENKIKWVTDEEAAKAIEELRLYAEYAINIISNGLTLSGWQDNLQEGIYYSLLEGFKGPTDEERKKYEEEIAKHNRKCEEFHKEHPHHDLEVLLTPGLSSVFTDSSLE